MNTTSWELVHKAEQCADLRHGFLEVSLFWSLLRVHDQISWWGRVIHRCIEFWLHYKLF